MKYFLLVYRRSTATLVEYHDLGQDGAKALAERFAIEKRERTNRDIEVVILSERSKDSLMNTHSRYLRTMSQLAQDLSAGLPLPSK